MNFNIPLHYLLSSVSILVPFIIGARKFHYLNTDQIIFWIYICIGVVTEVLNFYFAYNAINNLWYLNYFFGIEFGFLMVIFVRWENGVSRQILIYLTLVGFLVFGTTQIFLSNNHSYNMVGKYIENFIVLIAAIHILYSLIVRTELNLSKNYKFWISLGIFIYFGGTSFIFVMGPIIFSRGLPGAWQIHSLFNISSNILCGIGLFWARPNTYSVGTSY